MNHLSFNAQLIGLKAFSVLFFIFIQTYYVMVGKFQDEFIKSSFLPKIEQKIGRISALCSEARYGAEILAIFCSHFGRNDDFINSF
jgi:hypothetical protein